MNILGIGRDKSQSQFFTEGDTEPEYETERGQGRPHHLAAWPGLARARGWCGHLGHPLDLPFRLYIASDTKTLSTRSKIHERVCSHRHLHP